jgi:hypothetical protein
MSDGRGSSAASGLIVTACERCSVSMSRWAPCYSLQPTTRACPVPLSARRRRPRVPRRRLGCLCVATRFEGTRRQVLLPPLAPAVAGRREAGLEAVAVRPRLRRSTAASARSARACFRMRRMLSVGLVPPSLPSVAPSEGRPAPPPRPLGRDAGGAGVAKGCYLVDPASSHMLVSKIKPCMCKYELIQTVKLRMAH